MTEEKFVTELIETRIGNKPFQAQSHSSFSYGVEGVSMIVTEPTGARVFGSPIQQVLYYENKGSYFTMTPIRDGLVCVQEVLTYNFDEVPESFKIYAVHLKEVYKLGIYALPTLFELYPS